MSGNWRPRTSLSRHRHSDPHCKTRGSSDPPRSVRNQLKSFRLICNVQDALLFLSWQSIPGYLPQHLGRITCNHGILWHVLCHHTRGPDDTSPANCHAWQDRHITANEAVFPDPYRRTVLWTSGAISQFWIQRMASGEEAHIRSDQRPCADRHLARVQECAVEIYEDIVAQLDIGPVVNSNRRFDPGKGFERSFVFFLGRIRVARGNGRLVANNAMTGDQPRGGSYGFTSSNKCPEMFPRTLATTQSSRVVSRQWRR